MRLIKPIWIRWKPIPSTLWVDVYKRQVEIPAGCKIVVTRFNNLERKFTYSKSGEAGVFTNHQEIQLEPWKGYA